MLSTPPTGGQLFVEPLEQRIAPTNLIGITNHPVDAGNSTYLSYTTAPSGTKLGFLPAASYGVNGPSNLYAVAYPAVILAGMLCSKAELLLARRQLPPMTRHFLLPTRFALIWGAFLMTAAIPDFLHHSAHVVRHWADATATPFRANVAFVLAAYVRRAANWTTPVTLMLSLYGVAFFSYFMGRSAPSNLYAVAYPAVILAGMLCSKSELLLGRGKLPPMTRYFLLPTRFALIWGAFLMTAAIPDFLHHSAHVVRHWADATVTPFRANVAFVQAKTQPREDGVYFLSNHSGFYYYLSGTTRPINLPGTIELLQARDMDTLLNAIESKKFRKLFVEDNFFAITMYRADVYDRLRTAIAQNYRVEKAGPTGKLVLYMPQ